MPDNETDDLDSPVLTDDDDSPGSAAVKPVHAITAAILRYGGKHGGDARDILETFDFWAMTTDVRAIARAPVHKLVIADTENEIERRLAARYEAPRGFTMLCRERREVRESREEIKTWRGSARAQYKKRMADGWRVLAVPMLMGTVNSERHLLSLCIQNRQFIIDASSVESLGGSKYLESRSYVVTHAGGNGLSRIRWNPLLWRQREYRAKRTEAENRLRDTLPDHLINDLGDCLNPSHWPIRHPFHGMVDGIKGDQRDGGRSAGRKQAQYGIQKVVAYIRVNLRLTPHLRPWRCCRSGREGHGKTYRQILQEALGHIHGIRRNKSSEYRFLTAWLRSEARAMDLIVPPPPQVSRDAIGSNLRPQMKASLAILDT